MTLQSDSGEHSMEIPVVIHDELGLHARPAARLAQTAQGFAADIRLRADQGEADAKSILDILSLAVGYGSRVTLVCSGVDAEAAADTLRTLLESPLARGDS